MIGYSYLFRMSSRNSFLLSLLPESLCYRYMGFSSGLHIFTICGFLLSWLAVSLFCYFGWNSYDSSYGYLFNYEKEIRILSSDFFFI